ncbi:hypothetical protein [Muribaculum intestinale]|uniref:Uncharacterized protein n=1 Tax=Muribaculum intestinale TaxID=1796646 RepID=A0A4S2FRG0_9BACT|nr:hypothetical protein [Muribaculum intestinale]MYM13338.1 hypothetical protein [Muribaculum intestinale]TGY71718.1 hypothetical protein E5333_11085 [Muribaculum intestinale]
MKKVISWLKQSNRLKHIGGGIVIGAFADSDYCAAYAGIGVAAALELKDKLWGGKWDWIDFALTVAGVVIGRLIRIVICGK